MGLYLSTDRGEQYPLATVAGWGRVGSWIDSLATDEFPESIHLWEHGWCQRVPELRDELEGAESPGDPDAAHTVDALKEMLATVPDDAALVVSDGLTPDGIAKSTKRRKR